MLVEVAHHAANPRHPLNPYFRLIAARKGYKIAMVAVAHRLLRIMFAMLKDGSDFDVDRLNVVERKHQTKRTYYYMLKRHPQGEVKV